MGLVDELETGTDELQQEDVEEDETGVTLGMNGEEETGGDETKGSGGGVTGNKEGKTAAVESW
jgi:hypothetical protein